MAKDKDKQKAIEELAAELGTPPWVFEAVKVRQNWAAGKVVTEQEYKAAVNDFLKGRMVSRR